VAVSVLANRLARIRAAMAAADASLDAGQDLRRRLIDLQRTDPAALAAILDGVYFSNPLETVAVYIEAPPQDESEAAYVVAAVKDFLRARGHSVQSANFMAMGPTSWGLVFSLRGRQVLRPWNPWTPLIDRLRSERLNTHRIDVDPCRPGDPPVRRQRQP
jgi:hypothetical protein